MKTAILLLIILSFIGTGLSGFFFTKIQKEIDNRIKEIGLLENQNETLKETILNEKKKLNESQINLSETKAILATTRAESARATASFATLKKSSENLFAELEASSQINNKLKQQVNELKDSILNANAQQDFVSLNKIDELEEAIKELRDQNQGYQSKIQELENQPAEILLVDSPVDDNHIEDFSVRLLSIDLSMGLIVVNRNESTRVKANMQITLKKMGFTVINLQIVKVGSDYIIGSILPGINRLSNCKIGDMVDLTLPENI